MIRVAYITGCLGFIGSYVTRTCLKRGWFVLGIDSESYAARTQLLDEFMHYPNFSYQKKNINDLDMLYDCDYVINLAAETHVDNSIVNSNDFIRSNIDGVHNLLRLIQTKSRFRMPTLVQFSTDEVYGDIVTGSHKETDILRPSNPYAATKASADLLVTAWHRTYSVPYLIVRPTNNYGIGQYVEKFIPKTCKYLMLDKPVPMHERGQPRRTWLHAQDTADALMLLLDKDIKNDIYNISGNYEDSNLNVFKKIITLSGRNSDRCEDYADFEVQRAGQDVRYSIDDSKLRSLGWDNKKTFDAELPSVVAHHIREFVW